jgi:hypothetical protein
MTPELTRRLPGKFYDAGGAVFNVKHPDFGAKGDGSTNDAAAIENAIAAASAWAVAHNAGVPEQNACPTIVFPPGNYVLSNSIDTLVSTRYLRVVGLGNANLICSDLLQEREDPPPPPPFNGTVGWRVRQPAQVSFEGISFLGFPLGLVLGPDTEPDTATRTFDLVRCNFFGCDTGFKFTAQGSILSLESCKFNDNKVHMDVSRCDVVYLDRCYFQKFNPVNDEDVAIRVEFGRLHIQGGYFTPGDVTKRENAWIGIHGQPAGEAHVGVIAHGVRAGGESAGMTFVNFRAPRNTASPGNALTRVILRDSQLEPGQGGYETTRPDCVVRLWQVPNHLEITGCYWTNGRSVDFANGVSVTPPNDQQDDRLVYRVENNCDNGWPTIDVPAPDPDVPGNRTRHYMPSELESRVNRLGGIRRGTAIVPAGADSYTVQLGLPSEALPIRQQDISITPLGPLAPATSWWIGNVVADHFQIRTSAAAPAEGVKFAWSVDLRRYGSTIL